MSSDNERCLFYLHALDKKGGITAHKVGMVIVVCTAPDSEDAFLSFRQVSLFIVHRGGPNS